MQRLTSRGARRLGDERGAAAVVLSFLMVPMLGFAAIAVDIGALYAERARLQTAADAAATAQARSPPAGTATSTWSAAVIAWASTRLLSTPGAQTVAPGRAATVRARSAGPGRRSSRPGRCGSGAGRLGQVGMAPSSGELGQPNHT